MERINELLSAQILLEHKNRQLELITQTVTINFDESDSSMAARRVLARVMSVLEADAAELWVVDSQAQRLLRVAHQGLLPWKYSEEASLPIGIDLPGLAAVTKGPIVSFDLARDHRCLRQDFTDTLFHFFAAVPLMATDDVIGVLCVASLQPRSWSEEDSRFLESVGKVLGRRTLGLLLQQSFAAGR
jgi:GAF domain-containing protein